MNSTANLQSYGATKFLVSPFMIVLTLATAVALPLVLVFNSTFVDPVLQQLGMLDFTAGHDQNLHPAEGALMLSAFSPRHF